MINNPYIEKVKNHDKILIDLEKEIYPKKGKWDSFFGNKKDIILEIGTGLGNYFSKMVNQKLDKNFIGMEIKFKRVYVTAEKTLGNMKNNDISNDNTCLNNYNNDFIIIKDYAQNIDKIFDKNELSETLIFFPDPWDKKKKWLKNRLLQKNFLDILYDKTKKGGKMIFKTDHKPYFDFVLDEIKNTSWKLDYKTFDYESDGLYKQEFITEFEQIFRGQNIKVNYMELIKK